MKFIQVQDGISINASMIEGIKEKDKDSCEIYIGTKTYIATYPYSTLLDMLKSDIVTGGVKEGSPSLSEKLENFLDNSQKWAG